MSEITDKLKELGEKWANLPDCKEANEIADECMEMLPEVLERIEQLEKACAEMRDVLKDAKPLRPEWLNDKAFKDYEARFTHALSTSCGSDYIHLDEVRPLVEALRELYDKCLCADFNEHWEAYKQAEQSLTHADNLLKGETK